MTTETLSPADVPAQAGPELSRLRGTWRQYVAALRILAVLTVLLGLLYPLAVTGIARLPGLRDRADGSLVRNASGAVVGSGLLGQGFVDADGDPLRQWFQARPSAAGDGWDGKSSSASNLGPNNPDLVQSITERKAAVAAFDSVPGHEVTAAQVPADAVTTSGSGLDPDISPDYARQQAYRVAVARGLDPVRVLALVEDHVDGRVLGFLGEERVNVLQLNLALDRLSPGTSSPGTSSPGTSSPGTTSP
jgi:K+-transporting ATPase ATPase C chain